MRKDEGYRRVMIITMYDIIDHECDGQHTPHGAIQ